MTRHTPDFLKARTSQLSLRSLALEQSMASRSPSVTDAPDIRVDAKDLKPEAFTKPYTDFMTENPTVFHAVGYFKEKLVKAGYVEVRLSSLRPFSVVAGQSLIPIFTAPKPRQLDWKARAWREILCHTQWQLHHCLCCGQGV
jgi:hypothetical protein